MADMKYRKLRIAWSVACGILCLLLIVLLVRSCWWQDDLGYAFSDSSVLSFMSLNGSVEVSWYIDPFESLGEEIGTFATSTGIEDVYQEGEVPTPQFNLTLNGDEYSIETPHWLPMLLIALTGALPWFRWSNRFSLRTLLIGMTVVAVALGLIFALSR
jgi:hypothetical protein